MTLQLPSTEHPETNSRVASFCSMMHFLIHIRKTQFGSYSWHMGSPLTQQDSQGAQRELAESI
jgi:hypothetical protein